MATPVPPSQWTRHRLSAGGQYPEEEAQQRRLRQQARQQWEQAAAAAPQVRAFKARVEQEWLPQMERDVAEAEAAVEAARGRLMLRIVAEQNYQVLEAPGQSGQPVVFVSAEDQRDDVDLRMAELRLTALKDGRRRLREQLDEAIRHLAVVDYQRPPED